MHDKKTAKIYPNNMYTWYVQYVQYVFRKV